MPRRHSPARTATAARSAARSSGGNSSASARSSTVPSRGLCSPRSSPFSVRTLSPARSANAPCVSPRALPVLPEQLPEGLLPRSRHGSRLRSCFCLRWEGFRLVRNARRPLSPASAMRSLARCRSTALRRCAGAPVRSTTPRSQHTGGRPPRIGFCVLGGAELPTNCVFCVSTAHRRRSLRVARRGAAFESKLPTRSPTLRLPSAAGRTVRLHDEMVTGHCPNRSRTGRRVGLTPAHARGEVAVW